MTDDTRSRWELWPRRVQWSRHYWVANQASRQRRVQLPLSALTATVQTVYPDRVLLSVFGLTVGQVVTISRVSAGSTTRTTVRGADGITATSDALVVVDAEAPYGIQLTYYLTVDGFDTATQILTLTLTGGKVALSDAISGDAAEVVILAWPSKRTERPSTVFPINGTNIVVSGQRGGFSGTIDLFTETDDEKHAVLNLLETATSGILQIRQSGTYDGVDAYISVLSDDEQRYSQDGSDERRIISLEVVETGPWGPTLESSTFDLGDIDTAYTGLTLADIAADYSTLYDLALGDFS